MTAIADRIKARYGTEALWLGGLIVIPAICLLAFLAQREWIFLLIPFLGIIILFGLRDYKMIYLWLWATIPFSVELDLPGGFSTDFPVEPLMWLSCFLLPVYLFLRHKDFSFRFLYHPLMILVMIHFFWIIMTTVTSTDIWYSTKYTLAKGWYLVCFVLLPLLLLREKPDYKRWAVFLMIPLAVTIIIIQIRHSQYSFSFADINRAVIPIYRNHVDYACCLGILLPFAWEARHWFAQWWARWAMVGLLGLMVIGIYFSYTRAAWLCIPIAAGAYLIIRWRLMRVAILVSLTALVLITGWMTYNNRYLDFAPDYEKTITHRHFDDLISATAKMEDISTVERFYRWVAGFYMVKEKPVLGFGPATFYSQYHQYTDRHFTTYVSDNPEQSGIHNYYLMVAVEQGLVGILIFIILITAVLVYGERLWHRTEKGFYRSLLMAALVSFCCSLFVLTLNDTVETDKLGTFFFLCIAIVILVSMNGRSLPSHNPADR